MELSKEELEEIAREEGGEVTDNHGRKLRLLDRPDEAEKSRKKRETLELSGVITDFLKQQGQDIQSLISAVKESLTRQEAVPAVNVDMKEVNDSLKTVVQKTIKSAPKDQRVKDLTVEVIERERDPHTGFHNAKKYKVTPVYEDVK